MDCTIAKASKVFCEFGQIYWRNPKSQTSFFLQCQLIFWIIWKFLSCSITLLVSGLKLFPIVRKGQRSAGRERVILSFPWPKTFGGNRLITIWLCCKWFFNMENICDIWYHLHNLKKHKQHPWTSATFSKVCNNFTKSNILPWMFSRFSSCAIGMRLHKVSHIFSIVTIWRKLALP